MARIVWFGQVESNKHFTFYSAVQDGYLYKWPCLSATLNLLSANYEGAIHMHIQHVLKMCFLPEWMQGLWWWMTDFPKIQLKTFYYKSRKRLELLFKTATHGCILSAYLGWKFLRNRMFSAGPPKRGNNWTFSSRARLKSNMINISSTLVFT